MFAVLKPFDIYVRITDISEPLTSPADQDKDRSVEFTIISEGEEIQRLRLEAKNFICVAVPGLEPSMPAYSNKLELGDHVAILDKDGNIPAIILRTLLNKEILDKYNILVSAVDPVHIGFLLNNENDFGDEIDEGDEDYFSRENVMASVNALRNEEFQDVLKQKIQVIVMSDDSEDRNSNLVKGKLTVQHVPLEFLMPYHIAEIFGEAEDEDETGEDGDDFSEAGDDDRDEDAVKPN